MNLNKLTILLLFLLSNLSAQEIYFSKPVSPLIAEKKAFWKRIYADIDSSMTVIYEKTTLRTYAIVKNASVIATTDSIRKSLAYPNYVMVKQGRKEFIREAVLRAASYPFVIDSLAAHGLHIDLRWLPVLESGYLDTMVSDQNARGIWQFIPSIAKRFGLSLENIIDPLKSTSAFVQYFSSLQLQFDDYALALTAYHHGEGGIREKLKKRSGISSLDTIIPFLGFQSGNYYAKYLAIVDIAHELTKSTTLGPQ
jgi:hypothetical protein